MYVSKRDPFIDNARFILVVLVVFGHLISPLKEENELIYLTNNYLASFRMPALILLTGYFAKSFYKEGYIEKITRKLFFPFLFFQIFYAYLNYLLYDYETFSIHLLQPYMGLWFLLSLYYWNLLLFIFSKLKHPIIISLVLGVGIGCVDDPGQNFSILRTFVFFPFFLLGFYAQKVHLDLFKKQFMKIVSLVSIIISITMLHFYSLSEARGMLLGKNSYSSLNFSDIEGMGVRIIFYIIMLLGILAFLPWVPKKRTLFTRYGQSTAYIYLLHIACVKLIYTNHWISQYEGWKVLLLFVIALILSVSLCSKPMIAIFKPVVEGKFSIKPSLLVLLRRVKYGSI